MRFGRIDFINKTVNEEFLRSRDASIEKGPMALTKAISKGCPRN